VAFGIGIGRKSVLELAKTKCERDLDGDLAAESAQGFTV